MATNLPSELDPAVLDRVRSSVLFPLPDEVTMAEWWARHAKHLSNEEHKKLGRCSVGFSFRQLWRVSGKVCMLFAVGESPTFQLPPFAAIKMEIEREKNVASKFFLPCENCF